MSGTRFLSCSVLRIESVKLYSVVLVDLLPKPGNLPRVSNDRYRSLTHYQKGSFAFIYGNCSCGLDLLRRWKIGLLYLCVIITDVSQRGYSPVCCCPEQVQQMLSPSIEVSFSDFEKHLTFSSATGTRAKRERDWLLHEPLEADRWMH